MDGDALHIPRGRHGVLMAIASVAGVLIAWGVAAYLGATGATIRAAVMTLGIGSVLTFAPVFLNIAKEYWGVAVLFTGAARSLLVLALCYMQTQNSIELQSGPLFQGAVAGAIAIMVAETAAAVSILSKLERRREELKRLAGAATAKPVSDRT